MAKQVIILGKTTNDVWDNLQLLLWFPITAAGTLKTQANGSAWPKASASENQAIQTGAVQEEVFTVPVPVGLSASNPAAVEAWLQQMWINRNAQINGVGEGQFANVVDDSGAWGMSQ